MKPGSFFKKIKVKTGVEGRKKGEGREIHKGTKMKIQ